MQKKLERLYRALNGSLAPIVFIIVFACLAARIAFTKEFPLAYDESFHFGLIQLYTYHLNPFLAGQPVGANALGAVARDPSYLYHYLMSFPLRLISLFFHSTIEQIVSLRLLNIGLGVSTLLLLRKFALKLGSSVVVANLSMLLLGMTPVFYDLSAQINYDNLLIPLALVALLAAWNISNTIKQGQLPVVKLMQLFALLLVTSLVKYTFLPIMVATCLYITVLVASHWHSHALQWRIHWKSWHVLVAVLMLVISGTLWAQRYGVNLVAYHTPLPQCNVVLGIQSCSQYGPWDRNYLLQQSYASHPVNGLQLVSFTKIWLRSMFYGVYSVVHIEPGGVTFTSTAAVRLVAKVILIGALLYGLFRLRKTKGNDIPWILLTLVALLYTLSLWGQNFSDFHHLGALVGIQGRYLLPIVPIVYAVAARSYTLLAQDLEPANLRVIAAGYAITGMLFEQRVVRNIESYAGSMKLLFQKTRRVNRLRTAT